MNFDGCLHVTVACARVFLFLLSQQKSQALIYFVYFYSDSFFSFVRKKTKNLIVINGNLSFAKNILLFYHKVAGLNLPSDAVPVAPAPSLPSDDLPVARTCSVKKVSFKISQNSMENTCARARPATLLKKRLWNRCFPVNFTKFLRQPFFTEYRIPPVDASQSTYFSVDH